MAAAMLLLTASAGLLLSTLLIGREKALTEAVQRGEFVLAFQPQMSLVTGEIAGAEALLRWNHPREGLRLPGTFIPVAERTSGAQATSMRS